MDFENFDFETLESEVREQVFYEAAELGEKWQHWGFATVGSALVSSCIGIYTIANEANPAAFAASIGVTYLCARRTMRLAEEIADIPIID